MARLVAVCVTVEKRTENSTPVGMFGRPVTVDADFSGRPQSADTVDTYACRGLVACVCMHWQHHLHCIEQRVLYSSQHACYDSEHHNMPESNIIWMMTATK